MIYWIQHNEEKKKKSIEPVPSSHECHQSHTPHFPLHWPVCSWCQQLVQMKVWKVTQYERTDKGRK